MNTKQQTLDLVNHYSDALNKLCVQAVAECQNWKPWKTSEIALDKALCMLEHTEAGAALLNDEENGDKACEVIATYTDNYLCVVAKAMGIEADDLGASYLSMDEVVANPY